jgi:hypothetical protein
MSSPHGLIFTARLKVLARLVTSTRFVLIGCFFAQCAGLLGGMRSGQQSFGHGVDGRREHLVLLVRDCTLTRFIGDVVQLLDVDLDPALRRLSGLLA